MGSPPWWNIPLRCSSREPVFLARGTAGTVSLLRAPAEPMKLLEAAHRVQHPGKPLDLAALSSSRRPRELEQLAYTFTVSGITLSGVTHLVRHRMQSIVVPPIQSVDHSRVILPDSVAADPAALERYQTAVRDAHDRLLQIRERPALEKLHYYFAQIGRAHV